MIYFIMFVLSTAFFYCGDKLEKKKTRYLFDLIGLLIPLLMATLRAETVGNDVVGYIKPMYLCAKNSGNLIEYENLLLRQLNTRDLEWGFSLLGYIGTKLMNNIAGIFLIDEIIMLMFVYLALKKYNERISIEYQLPKIKIFIGMFCYLTLFYNMSLSMTRQSMACSLVLYSIACLASKQYKRSVVAFVFAISIHSTALVGVILIALYICVDRKWNRVRKLIIPIGVLFSMFGGKMYWLIMNFLNSFIAIPPRYLTYNYMWNQGNGVNLAFVYLISCAFFCLWVLMFKERKENGYLLYLKYITWFTLFLTPMSVAAANVSRILYYFIYFFIILFPMIANSGNRIKAKYKPVLPMMICTIFWMGSVLFNDYTGTLNYLLA